MKRETMKRMVCKACGGVLKDISFGYGVGNRWLCEYCGSEYITRGPTEQPYIAEVLPARCEALKAGVTMADELLNYLDPTEAKELIKRRLADKLANELINKMDLIEENDPATMSRRYTASIRIYQSGYKFGWGDLHVAGV